MADEFLESQKRLRDKGIKIDFLNPADNPHRERTNKDLAAAIKADEAKPMFGRGISTPENRTANATGMGTGSKTSVGRANLRTPAKSDSGGAKAAPASKPKMAAPAPAKSAASKPAKKKKAASAPAKKKYAEDTQANMTRVGKDKAPSSNGAAAKGPKRVSPGRDAIMAAQPKRSDYRGGMVIREPTKGYGRPFTRREK